MLLEVPNSRSVGHRAAKASEKKRGKNELDEELNKEKQEREEEKKELEEELKKEKQEREAEKSKEKEEQERATQDADQMAKSAEGAHSTSKEDDKKTNTDTEKQKAVPTPAAQMLLEVPNSRSVGHRAAKASEKKRGKNELDEELNKERQEREKEKKELEEELK